MLKYLNRLPNIYKKHLNLPIMRKDYDKDLAEHLFLAVKGLETIPNIKITGFTWDPDESNYNVNDHIIRRNSNKNKVVKNIAETRCGVLYIDAEVSGVDKNGKHKIHYIKKPIIIPIQDEHGYYLIRGKTAYILYQLVDKISYPSIGAVTVKSLMPICVKIHRGEFTDTDGNTYNIPTYTIQIFKSSINVLLIYSHIATKKMLQFLEVHRFITVLPKDNYEKRDDMLYFECAKKSNVVIGVKKDAFQEFIYVRSIVGCLIKLFDETKVQFEDSENWENWMTIVGGKNTIRRGIYQHIFFNRLLDDITRMELKVNDHDKQNIYYLLRWMIQNFTVLWSKDNLSMENKRLRCNEYLGSIMTAQISQRINRLVSLGDKATLKDYLSCFRFPEDIFISKLFASGVLRYSESINAIDNPLRWTVTKKGPNQIGVLKAF